MQNFFNLKLYKEGLKKIRLVGIIAGIVMILVNAIVPIARLVDSGTDTTQTVVQMTGFAVPSILLLFLTPFFFLSMFSYLNKRNESDFYHAIPYKRSCVLFSFLASIFTWIWGVLLVSLLVTGGLWALCPHTTVAFSAIPKLFGIYAFSSLYVGGFILLGMTLTGTIVSNIALSGVLLFFVRVVSMLLSVVLEELIPLFDIAYSPMRIFSMRYWLPAALLQSFYDASAFTQVGLWIYSAVVTLGLYVLAIVLYCRRKSESANKSAPSKRLQHLYRCVFTIPFALLTTLGIIYREMDAFVILALLAVAVYFLYELITTKNLRSTVRSAPFLIIPILCTALFTGGCYLIRGAVLENAYKPEEIQSVRSYRYASMYDLFDKESGVYENVVTQSIAIKDPEAIQIVSDSLQKNIQDIKNNRYDLYYRGDVEQHIEIILQSGRKVGRKIRFSEENYQKLQERKTASEEFLEAYISIPSYKDIQNLYVDYAADVSSEELKTLWGLFTEEYQALSTEEKLAFKKGMRGQDPWDSVSSSDSGFLMAIRGHGVTDSAPFTFSYEIPASFVRTRSYYNTLMQKTRDGILDEINRLLSGEYDEKLEDQMEEHFSIDMQNRHQQVAASLFFGMDYKLEDAGSSERFKECLRVLLPYLTDEPTDDNYCILTYQCYDHDNGSNRSASTVFGLREMTEEETSQLVRKLSFTSAYENKLLEIMKAYAEKDYPSDMEEFSFETDYGNVYTNLSEADEKTLAKLQQGCEILLRHITGAYDMSNGYISFTDRHGEMYAVSVYIDWSKLTESETASLSEAFGLKF